MMSRATIHFSAAQREMGPEVRNNGNNGGGRTQSKESAGVKPPVMRPVCPFLRSNSNLKKSGANEWANETVLRTISRRIQQIWAFRYFLNRDHSTQNHGSFNGRKDNQ